MPIGNIKLSESHFADPLNIFIIPTNELAKKSKYLKKTNTPIEVTNVAIKSRFLYAFLFTFGINKPAR